MRLRQAALAGNGRRHRDVEPLDEAPELGLAARKHDAAAADECRGPGGQQRLQQRRRILLGRCGGEGRIGGMARLRPDRVRIDGVALDVDGEAEMGGPGPARGHGPEGGAHHVGQHVGPVEHGVPLGQRAHQAFLVQLGQRVVAARRDRDIRGDRKDGHGGLVRLDQPRQDIGRAAARRAFAYARPVRHARIAVRHIGSGAFVARQDMVDLVVEPVERIVEGQRGVPAKAEYVPDAVRLQHPDHRFGAVQDVSGGLPRSCSAIHRQPSPFRLAAPAFDSAAARSV